MKYHKNLTWFLSQLAAAEPEQFETGEIEIIGEDEQGREGSVDVSVAELALAAGNRIDNLENALAVISAVAKNPSTTSTGVRPDISSLVEEALKYQEPMSRSMAAVGLRVAIQEAEPYGLVRTENGQVITGAVESDHGIVLTEN